MAFHRLTRVGQKYLLTTSTTVIFEPITDWMPAIGVDNIQAVLKVKAVIGLFQGQLAIQTAAVRTDNPDAWAALDQMQAQGERFTGVESVSATLASKQYFRLGVAYNLSGGSAMGQGECTLEGSIVSLGRIVGGRTFQAYADENEEYFEPVTGWISTLECQKAKAALVVSGVSGNFTSRLVYRTATTNIENTSGWAGVEAGFTAGALERNTGEVTLTVTSDMWVQFGIGYKLTAAGAVGVATVSAVVGVRRN